MMIAVCLSGSIKNTKSIEYIEKLSNKHLVYIFIHTWNISNLDEFNSTLWSKSNTLELENINLFNPKKILIEDFSDRQILLQNLFNAADFKNKARHDIGTVSMYYSIFKSNELKKEYEKENNITFDCVIRSRFDSDIISELEIESYDLSKVNIPIGKDWGGLNDQFAFGNSDSMDIYSDLINNLSSVNSLYHPETMLQNYITLKNLNINRCVLDARIHYE
jgi:hypothetical protein